MLLGWQRSRTLAPKACSNPPCNVLDVDWALYLDDASRELRQQLAIRFMRFHRAANR